MRSAAESVNAYGVLFPWDKRGLSRRPQAAETVSAADLQRIDSFAALGAADRAAVMKQTGAMLRAEMEARFGED